VVSVTPRPRFTAGERTPGHGTLWTGGWVGLRADLDTQARAEGLELWVAPPEGRSWSSGGGELIVWGTYLF
jgi:hypothetical protein